MNTSIKDILLHKKSNWKTTYINADSASVVGVQKALTVREPGNIWDYGGTGAVLGGSGEEELSWLDLNDLQLIDEIFMPAIISEVEQQILAVGGPGNMSDWPFNVDGSEDAWLWSLFSWESGNER